MAMLYINFRDGNIVKVTGDNDELAQSIHNFMKFKAEREGGYDKLVEVNGEAFFGIYCVSEIAGMTLGPNISVNPF
jgi:hypothetical protein